MSFIRIKNNQTILIKDIPQIEFSVLREDIIKENKRPLFFYGLKEDSGIKLFIGLSDDEQGEILVSSSFFKKDETSFESITPHLPAFHIFEREFYEEFSIEPKNHPWLKPVRKQDKEYKFFEMAGEEIHQVAVGPIHAGIIEPGHFRFMCLGEKVYNLEIRLGYQNRNVEQLFLNNKKFNNRLAESICGDSVVSHNLAYTQVMESLLNINISNKAQLIRLIALEMERTAIHIGDMGAIAGDIAYLMGASVFGATRTLVINTLLDICGSRFARGLINVGGVNFDICKEQMEKYLVTLEKIEQTVKRMTKTMLNSSSVVSRLEKTGYLSKEQAIKLNIIGIAGKASGNNKDSRVIFENKWYKNMPEIMLKPTGDVYARFCVRYKEVLQSIKLIRKFFTKLENYEAENIKELPTKSLAKNSFCVSVTEGWRGEIVHCAITDDKENILRYKVKDTSFNNWFGLALAVKNNEISDFPLCNKSFNLSYCGNDL